MSDDALAVLKAVLAEKLSLPDYREVEAHLAGVVVLPPDQRAQVLMALHDLERCADELDLPQTEWRWDELRLVRVSLDTLRAALAVLR